MEINKVYNESNVVTMKKMADCFVDYSLTSPPYNISSSNSNELFKKYKEFSDDLSNDDYFSQQVYLINELLRVTKNHVFYNIQMLSGNKFALHKLIGYFAEKIKEVIIWNKGFGQPAISPKVFNSAFEYIIIFSNVDADKRYFKDANFERGTQSNLYRIKNKNHNDFSDVHSAVMPLDIPRYFMLNFGNENDLWYDPYGGTGTTAIASVMEKKRFILSEISAEYCDIANKRISNYINAPTLF